MIRDKSNTEIAKNEINRKIKFPSKNKVESIEEVKELREKYKSADEEFKKIKNMLVTSLF